MKYAGITDRLARLGGEKWQLHLQAKALRDAGEPVIMLTIGEPDIGTPPELLSASTAAMTAASDSSSAACLSGLSSSGSTSCTEDSSSL